MNQYTMREMICTICLLTANKKTMDQERILFLVSDGESPCLFLKTLLK